MDLFEKERDYKEVKIKGKIGFIDRTFSDDIAVKLPCGYLQRFWANYSDEKALEVTNQMKSEGIESA